MLFRAIHFVLRASRALARRLGARFATRLHHAALGGLGSGAVIQTGVSLTPPGNVQIGSDCYLWRGVHATSEAPGGILKIGNRVQINRDAHLDFTGNLRIGDDVMISEGAVLYTHDHGLDPRSKPAQVSKSVGAGVWVGMRAVILPQCQSIGANAVIGAGAIVTRDVPAGAIVAGNPARIIGQHDAAAVAA
jgi:hypothetical protein